MPVLRIAPPLSRWYTGQVAANLHGGLGARLPDARAAQSHGEVSEWLKEHAWKACSRVIVTWVRIPPSPPAYLLQFQFFGNTLFFVYL